MIETTLTKLSICKCGFNLLHDNIKVGTRYKLYPNIYGLCNLTCGGCHNIIIDIKCMGASCITSPDDTPRLLPINIFEGFEGIE